MSIKTEKKANVRGKMVELFYNTDSGLYGVTVQGVQKYFGIKGMKEAFRYFDKAVSFVKTGVIA